ncbi:MAG: hypothetical protein M1463_02930 [Candidatus Thermoplasmatota archaeon]|nr:hypothetical protein [Candidatus Thermoplasmatota archaeon]
MLVEDQRNISCGGDPFNYLKSLLKGLFFDLSPGQDAKVLLLSEKFPYKRDLFESLSKNSRLKLVEMKEEHGEIELIIRRDNQ